MTKLPVGYGCPDCRGTGVNCPNCGTSKRKLKTYPGSVIVNGLLRWYGDKPTIKVHYDGKYPNACCGTLCIKINGEEIYKKNHCCHVEDGELLWDDADLFSKDIQRTVEKELAVAVLKKRKL